MKTNAITAILGDVHEMKKKRINYPCFLLLWNVYFLHTRMIWCGLKWKCFSLSWASCQLEAFALPDALLWHVWGSCSLVRRPTVQTAAWSSALQTKTTGRMTVASLVRGSRGVYKQTQTVWHCDEYRRINKNTDLHTLDWNHVWSLKTSLVLYPNIREWNGGKPKMETLAEVLEGHDRTVL